jgi:large subunit ribosomal protein L4
MTKLNIYNVRGLKKGSFNLPKNMEEKLNLPLLAQAVYVYRDNSHPGLGKTKTRGEVKISTRKIYRQKGTGGARHGAKSAPIFVGGGTAHGKKGIKKILKLSKNLKTKAMKVALSAKIADNHVVVVDGIVAVKKTNDAIKMIKKMMSSEKSTNDRLTLVIAKENKEALMAFRNIKNVRVVLAGNLNARDLYIGGFIILDKSMFEKPKKVVDTKSGTVNKAEKVVNKTKAKTGKKLAVKRKENKK